MQRQHLVIIEGNISAGKSTLCKDLARCLGLKVFLEPVTTNPYLADFYKDPQTYALPMQVYLLKRRFSTYMAALRHMLESGEGAVLDRSIFSDWVFAEKNRLDATIGQEGFEYYSAMRSKLLEDLPFPHVTVYLDSSPQTCWERIHGVRRRDAELESGGIPMEYLAGLDRCYQSLLQEMEQCGSAVLRFDWNRFGSVETVAERVRNAQPKQPAWDVAKLRRVAYDTNALANRSRVDTGFRVTWDDSKHLQNELDEDANNMKEMASLDSPSKNLVSKE